MEDCKLEIKKLKDELSQLKSEFHDFVYIVSHDFKAEFRAISNLSLWIAEDLEGNTNEEINENIKMIQERTSKLHKMVDSLLEYSRITRFNLEKSKINIKELINDIVEDLMLTDSNSINLKINGNVPDFISYNDKLKTVFRNLIDNSIKFNNNKEKIITIDILTKDDFVEFRIRDNGQGISENLKNKVFDVFFKVVEKNDHESLGIGLTIAKKTVEFVGGKIWLNNNKEGETEFIFTWPYS